MTWNPGFRVVSIASQGKKYEDVLKNLKEALELYYPLMKPEVVIRKLEKRFSIVYADGKIDF